MEAVEKVYDFAPGEEGFLEAVLSGLSQPQKELPCKFLYDEKGSQLFDQICQLDEYYPTRTELALLSTTCDEIAGRIGDQAVLIEFGCGSLQKVRLLLDAMQDPAGFIPIDISKEHLLASAESLARDYPGLRVLPVCADYTQAIELPDIDGGGKKRVGFFPGSTIGNFGRQEAEQFLRTIAEILGPGGELLIGVDLKKDEAILNAAYDDAKGVTAAFNLNILERINRELGGDFDLKGFEHCAYYRDDLGRVEMHLKSLREQDVEIAGRHFHFEQGETIHTENSHKYSLKDFSDLAIRSGFSPVESWTDPDDLFSIHYLRVT
ncbi:MAG: L-histidine N(alpha)-methyltransferase [Alphaproteobacteria bacterium]|nr:L-histidine N(alpha)-methyltransferase [Alphaproteobacteria bacterium]